MFSRWIWRGTGFVWAALIGPPIGFIAGQRLIGVDCQLSPTAGTDILAALSRAADAIESAFRPLATVSTR
jgi:hypothetical protein